MKHNFYPLALLSFCALLAFGSCSQDEITTAQENQITLNGHKLNISIQEEAFEAEKPVSRNIQPTKTDTVDLGNDLYAGVSVEPDTEAPAPAKTRAAMSDGHYTIYAVDASNNRLPDELSGTMVAGQFIPDHNQNIDLTPGTYTFVCFNDAVEDKGNGLDIKHEVENPMIGVTTETISGEHYKISFIMKHWSARVRYEVTTYTAYPANLSAQIWGYTGDYGIAHFDQKGVFKIRDFGSISSTTVNINKAGNEAFSPIKKAFLSKSNYSYVSLRVGQGWWKATIDGTVHGKSVHKHVWKLDNLETNHSYLIKLNLKTKDPLYLYQDGTVGYIGDKVTGVRQPIALVVTEKTATDKGMAVALKDGEFRGVPGFRYYNLGIAGDDGTVDNMQGYDLTYTTNYYSSTFNYDRTVPPAYSQGYGGPVPQAGSENTNNAYYIAAHYDPGVTVTGENVGKWFLASSGQWKLFLSKLGGLDATKVTNFNAIAGSGFGSYGTIAWEGTKMATYFTQAGGTFSFGEYAVSGSDHDNNTKALYVGLSATKAAWGGDIFVTNYMSGFVRPFVYF